MNFRQLTYGILSFLPGIPESLYKGTGGTVSADYCYCIWLRHLVLAHNAGMQSFPSTVAELGPGDSIGTGLAALLSGASRYLALDAIAHADTERNLRVFDALVELFHRRAAIPGPEQFPEIKLDLADSRFPHAILTPLRMQDALADERIAWLRGLVSGERCDPTVIDYRAPWDQPSGTDTGSVDFILTNAVMEHVADLPAAYVAMQRWLRPGGFASHQIDFRSHGLFKAWDGHWACPDWLWRLFLRRRTYLLNREPFATHRALAGAAGFRERHCVRIESAPASRRPIGRFRDMSAPDRSTCGGYLLLEKAAD
jgi:SAM-dependent methyltransferase